MSSYSSLTNDESIDLNYGYFDQVDVGSATIGDLEVTGTERVGQLIDMGLSTNALVSTDGSKTLQSLAIVNSNGASTTLVGSALNVSNEQNLATTGQPTFAQLTDTGLTTNTLVGSSATQQLQSLSLASNNGMVSTVNSGVLTISTPQDLRTSAKVFFNQANIINNNNCVHNTTAYTPTGTGNTALGGYQSMGYNRNISSSNCTSAGTFALQGLVSGSKNTAVGYNTLKATTNQINNTAIGGEAGLGNTGSHNTFIGTEADTSVPIQNSTAIGYQAKTTASNSIVLGNSAVTSLASGSDGLCDLGSSTQKMKNIYSKGLILDNLTASALIGSDASKNLQSLTLNTTNNNGTNNSLTLSGSTLTLNSNLVQNLGIGSNPSFGRPYITGTPGGVLVTPPLPGGGQMYSMEAKNGKFLMGSFDPTNFFTFWQNGTITGSGNITVTTGSPDPTGTNPYINIDTVQPITTGSTPTFTGVALSSLTSNSLVYVNSSKQLTPLGISNSNGSQTTLNTTLGLLECSNSQNLSTGSTPTFTGVALSGLTSNSLVYVNSSKQLTPLGISNSNGNQTTLNTTSGLLECSNSQNLSASGSPSFSNVLTDGTIHFQSGVTDADFVIKSDTFNGLQFYDIARGAQIRIFQGKVMVDVGLYLPTTGGTASSLDYYEQYTHTTQLQGPWSSGSNPAISFQLTRIGQIVSCVATQDVSTLCSIASTITTVDPVPSRFRPSFGQTQTGVTFNSAPNPLLSRIRIETSGVIQYWSGAISNFTIGTYAGVYRGLISWSV